MKATELRIGNLVKVSNNTINIFNITCVGLTYVFLTDEYEDYDSTPEDLIPIPLTEEWLLKFGFEKPTNEKPYNFKISAVAFLHSEFQNELKCFNGNKLLFSMPCEYVHQLQNIFFALCGKELTIKNEK